MKFTCSRDLLAEGLNIVQKAIPGKSNLPVLECVLIDVSEDLVLTGSDTEISINYQVSAIIEEIGSVAVPAKVFADIVRKLPDIWVTVETSENNSYLIISSGNFKLDLQTFSAEQYPKVNFGIESNDTVCLSKNNFKNLVKQTAFAASTDSTRMILRGVLIENKGGFLKFVAIDGFRLAIKSLESSYENEFRIVVPARVLNEVSKIIEKGDDNISLSFNDNQIMFSNNSFKLVSSLLKGEFADYERMVPTDFNTVMNISTFNFSNSLDRVSVVLDDDKKWPIVLKTYPDELFISVAGEKGNTNEVLNVEISGQDIEIYFNEKNLYECLKAIDSEKVTVSFTSQKGPCLITSEEDNSFMIVVMPVKPKVR